MDIVSVDICVMVIIGLEFVVVEECEEKLGCKFVRKGRGCIYFDILMNLFI